MKHLGCFFLVCGMENELQWHMYISNIAVNNHCNERTTKPTKGRVKRIEFLTMAKDLV